MNAIIVDDESNGIEALKWELARAFPEIIIVQTFTSPLIALEYLNNDHLIDLVFLDIQMPEMSGFEMLDKLNNIDFSIVFVTSFDSFALKAFEFSALDYIVKPADRDSLKRAIEKYKNGRARKEIKMDTLEQLEIHRAALKGTLPEKLVFSTKEAYEFIAPKSIQYCESYNNYTTIYMGNDEKLVVSITLKEIEKLLTDYGFQRIHQRFVVNLSQVKRFIKSDGGSVELISGKGLPVSRSKKDAFISRLNS